MRVFVSHARSDTGWAEWVSWQLKQAGHEVELGVWHWPVGDNLVLRTSHAIGACDRMIAIWSERYFDGTGFTEMEWTAIVAGHGKTIPFRVEPVDPPAILGTMIYRDLFGIEESRAREVVLDAVDGQPHGPVGTPRFRHDAGAPGAGGGVRWPPAQPLAWNLPRPAGVFVGRDGMLLELRNRLSAGGRVAVHALHGWGGVGKTTLAVEYVHRFAAHYTLAWWIDAERPELIAEQLADLASAAGWVPTGTPTPQAIAAVRRHCLSQDGWVLVYDNATNPADLEPWLPEGPGHIIVTSRHASWELLAKPLSVDVFTRAESVALLYQIATTLDPATADLIAEKLGDLPLAVAQAGGFLAETGISGTAYLTELERRISEAMDQGTPPGYPRSLAATIRIATDRVAEDPAALSLLRLCAALAPEPVPLDLLLSSATVDRLPDPLVPLATNNLAVARCVSLLGRLGLVKSGPDGPVMHRLTQAIVIDQLDPTARGQVRALAEALIAVVQPEYADQPQSWPTWTRLLPHLLVLEPAATTNEAVRSMAAYAMWYLMVRGDLATVHALTEELYDSWDATLGPDDPATLSIAYTLATIYRRRGDFQRAYDIDHDALERERRHHGDDHPRTLSWATSLGMDVRQLGVTEQAFSLDQDTLARYRHVLGPDDPDTLACAHSFGVDLYELGRLDEALALDQDTLNRKRRVLGPDHPDTLAVEQSIAIDLYGLGRFDEALALNRDTLERYRRVLGPDHPHTLNSAHNLAIELRALRRNEEALTLDQDTLERYRRVLGDHNPSTIASTRSIANGLHLQGNTNEPLTPDQPAHNLYRTVLPPERHHVVEPPHNATHLPDAPSASAQVDGLDGY